MSDPRNISDWKGDPVLSLKRVFGRHFPLPIPPEFSDEVTLLAHLGISSNELDTIWKYRDAMYQIFSIAKGNGKKRTISAPDRRLKIIQTKLTPLLGQLYLPRNPVHGFVPTRSVKTNAAAHGRRGFVINLDIQDFFPSITERRIRGLLRSLDINIRVADIITHLCCVNGHLPQGAPTSPILSNMICFRLDTDILRIAKGARAIYTRYADDITISTYQQPAPLFDGTLPSVGRFSPEMLGPALRDAFESNGFTINLDKAHYADKNSRRIVTGVKINAGLNVDRRYVRHIRALLHSVETIGLHDAQQKYTDKGGKGTLAAHLRGKISYIIYLKCATDPVVRSLALRFNQSFRKLPIKLESSTEERHERSVWVVEHSGNCGTQGTAFFLKDIGLVTASHCVEKASDLVVYHPSNPSTRVGVTVLKYCSHRDLAILSHTIHGTEYFEFDASVKPVKVGGDVTAFGYPDYGPGDKINVRSGSVTSYPKKHGVQMIEVSQELAQGMSGGPIVDRDHHVIGVVHKGGPNEARQLAIAISELQKWVTE